MVEVNISGHSLNLFFPCHYLYINTHHKNASSRKWTCNYKRFNGNIVKSIIKLLFGIIFCFSDSYFIHMCHYYLQLMPVKIQKAAACAPFQLTAPSAFPHAALISSPSALVHTSSTLIPDSRVTWVSNYSLCFSLYVIHNFSILSFHLYTSAFQDSFITWNIPQIHCLWYRCWIFVLLLQQYHFFSTWCVCLAKGGL